jgi:hypothetical protein
MSSFQKLLMTFGAFGLSTQTIALFAWIFMKLNNGIIYGDGLLNAVAMGMMISMGSALSAALGAALVSSSLDSPKPVRWAFIVAFLYVLLETKRLIFHSHSSAGRWYAWLNGAINVWPALLSITAAVAVARLWRKRAHSRPQVASTR